MERLDNVGVSWTEAEGAAVDSQAVGQLHAEFGW